MQDLRDRNIYFKNSEIITYLREYAGAIALSLNKIDEQNLEIAKDILTLTHLNSGRVFVGGNGGSCAIADHLTCDFIKGTHSENSHGLQAFSLVGHQALFTALANDVGYQYTFSSQLELLKMTSKDCLILISSSGNSPNIIHAAHYAKRVGAEIIGLTGFDGGELRNLATAKLHIPFNNYGVIEDCHQALMHILAQFIYLANK